MIETNDSTGEVFKLFESNAIMRYLVQSRNLPDHWYPKDPVARAKVDQYLDWHHTYLRTSLGYYINKLLFRKQMDGSQPTMQEIDYYKLNLKDSLSLIERWLTENPFLCGLEISIADIAAACELI